MNRNRCLLVILLITLPSPVLAQQARRPNIVLMMADDQGWGETSYNGHPFLKTSVQDEMAATCLRFDRFYSAAPVCSPTRASVLTGRHPNRSGVFAPNHSTRPEEITIGQILKRAGYRTGHFGKWHVGAVKASSPTNPGWGGFEEWLSHDNFFEMHPPLSRNGADPTIHHGDSSNIIVDAAIDFLKRVNSDAKREPFFVVIWFGSPHSPYRGLAEDVGRFPDVNGEQLKHRFAEITAMDRSIGRFRKFLRDTDVADDTLLWYTSDNGMTVEGIPNDQRGQQFNGNLRGRKGNLYEGGVRVPGIIEWPNVIQQPRATSVPCVTSDIFPTILALVGLKSPDPDRPIDGVDLSPLILNSSGNEAGSFQRPPIGFWKYNRKSETKNERWMPEELTRGTTPTTRNPGIDFVNFRHPVAKTNNFGGEAAWMNDRYKLLVGSKGSVELFDLHNDSFERTDLSQKHPEVVDVMRKEMRAWQRSVEVSLSGADYRPSR